VPAAYAIRIVPMRAEDWPEVRAIYIEGIATGLASFETEPPSWETWHAAHRTDCRFVARDGGDIVGFAALSPVSSRCVYEGVAEVSVYVATAAQRRGIGLALLEALGTASEAAGLWTLQAAMFVENTPSVALHERCGFQRVGVRERLGVLRGRWHDVLLMERRSAIVGA
jgi:phosphinothricin acetyltransferase